VAPSAAAQGGKTGASLAGIGPQADRRVRPFGQNRSALPEFLRKARLPSQADDTRRIAQYATKHFSRRTKELTMASLVSEESNATSF
jgi:hypothetical protein